MDNQQGPTVHHLELCSTSTWQPEWEESLGENGYMYMYGWIPLLSTWNYHNIVNRLYSNKKLKKEKAILDHAMTFIMDTS